MCVAAGFIQLFTWAATPPRTHHATDILCRLGGFRGMSSGLLWRCGQWCVAPHGITKFDRKKDTPGPRPAVVIDSYGGFLRLLGRSAQPNDALHKLEHEPHLGRCDLGSACGINKPGYVSTLKSDVWTPLPRQIEKNISCFEPDENFVEQLFECRSRLS